MEALSAFFDISPPPHFSTACHGQRNSESRRVAVPFEANFLALREGGELVVIVSLDWFFVSPHMRQRILELCAGKVSDLNLVIAASHAHTSPNTDQTKTGFSNADHGYVSRVEHAVAVQVARLIEERDWLPAQLKFAIVHCDSSMHRRRKIWWPAQGWLRRKTSNYPNPNGPRDKDMRLLRVETMDGEALAFMWGISCHPTEWPRTKELSSDYPGLVRESLRKKLGRPLPVLFLQGFCGDLRPPAIGRWARRASSRVRLVMFLCSLVNGKFFAGWSAQRYERWVANIAQSANRAVICAEDQPALTPGLSVVRIVEPLSSIGLSAAINEIAFHRINIGGQLALVGISAEVTWEYAGILREMYRSEYLWPVGYIDHVFGYLPTESMLSEGGYEVEGFQSLFAVEGAFAPNTEKVVRSCVEDLLRANVSQLNGVSQQR